MINSLFILLILLSGCVRKSTYLKEKESHQSEMKRLQDECYQAYSQYDLQTNLLESEIKEKDERLSKFNQIDAQGRLKTNTWKIEKDKPLTGKEEWMK